MSDYYFVPQENMTHEEVVAILSFMIEYSTFSDKPKGAERHFVGAKESVYYKICVNCGAANEFTGNKLCIECGYPHDRYISKFAKKLADWLTK